MGVTVRPPTQQPSHYSISYIQKILTSIMDLKSKQEFVFFMRRALASDADDCYIELYNLLLRSFIAADVDFDGKVDAGEFTGMIESAAALLRKFDSDWWEDGKPREELSVQLTTIMTEPSLLTSGSPSPFPSTAARWARCPQ